MSEMRVVGVRVELPANQPILLLRETNGDRYLPIWIGSVEATAIALEQQGVKPARPLTHDLLKDVDRAPGRRLEQVRITDLQEGTFYAELVFDGGVKVSARPSDSVALALRVGRADPRRGERARRGRPHHPGRAGGRGREVPRVPRLHLARGLPRRPAVASGCTADRSVTPRRVGRQRRRAALTPRCARAYGRLEREQVEVT